MRGRSSWRGVAVGVALALVGSAASAPATMAGEGDWPGFRGPEATGVADGRGLPERWSTTENVAWKRDLPGRGWSSPVVAGGRVFVTTVVNTGTSEDPTKGLYFGGNRPTPPESVHQWKVICLDLATGEVRWERQVHEGRPTTPMHLKSSYASETPVTDGERVYCLFGNLGLYCFDLDGKELWRKTIEPRAMRYGWGTAASPALHEGRLYVVNDNDEESYLAALDARTGNEVWRTERDEKSNWATPFVWRSAQRTEIVTAGTGAVRSYDLNGKLLWSLGGMSSITIATPYATEDRLIVSSGYVMDPKRPLYAVRPGASGEITPESEEAPGEHLWWWRKQAGPYNPTTLAYQGVVYVLYDRGTIAAFDAKDGSEVFPQKRLPNGRAFTASPWAADGRVYCLNENGVTFVLKAGREFELLHTNELAEDDMGMATPAVAGDRLLIRTGARIYCLRNATVP